MLAWFLKVLPEVYHFDCLSSRPIIFIHFQQVHHSLPYNLAMTSGSAAHFFFANLPCSTSEKVTTELWSLLCYECLME